MKSQIRPALVLFALFTVATGFAYPALVTAVAQVAMPWRANGSLVAHGGANRLVPAADDLAPIGSELIGQPFDEAGYFWSRPSATATYSYNAAASSGSNLGPTNAALSAAVRARVDALRAADPHDAANPGSAAPVPINLVTSSASGLDPDITPAAALYQVPRVARARGVAEERVERLVREHVEGRVLGIFGEAHVNVLRLNVALDELAKHQRCGAKSA